MVFHLDGCNTDVLQALYRCNTPSIGKAVGVHRETVRRIRKELP
jgi:hypothetical protein